jgi:hypothetical protein
MSSGMNTAPSLRTALRLAPFAAILVLTACTGTVVGGGGTAGGTNTGASPVHPTPCDPETDFCCGDGCPPPSPPGTNAIAISGAELGYGGYATTSAGAGGAYNGTGAGGASGTGGYGAYGVGGGYGGPDGSTIFFELGSLGPTCGNPQPSASCGVSYGVSIGLPASMVAPGVIQLNDPSVISTFSETGAPYSQQPGDCPGGGGSFVNGTLTITDVTATTIAFTLAGTLPFQLGSSPADGAYVAARCH